MREKRAKEGKKVPEVVVIDARKKASASAMKYFPRAVPVPFALHYIEKSALGAVCRALCCCIYVEGEIRFPSPTPMSPLPSHLVHDPRARSSTWYTSLRSRVRTFLFAIIPAVPRSPRHATKRCQPLSGKLAGSGETYYAALMVPSQSSEMSCVSEPRCEIRFPFSLQSPQLSLAVVAMRGTFFGWSRASSPAFGES